MPHQGYRFTKIVIPGWEKSDQRAYLVVDRETGEPLGQVHDQRLWNMYDPHGEDWVTIHSNNEITRSYYSTRKKAAQRLWRAREPVEVSADFPPINLRYAKNFDHEEHLSTPKDEEVPQ